MKLIAKILMILGCAGIMASSFCACEDEDKSKNEGMAIDPNRESGGKVDQISAANAKSFYNGYTASKDQNIVIDIREKKDYLAGHLKGSVSMPVDENAFWYDDDPIYLYVEKADPSHNKCIVLMSDGASQLTTHVAGRISAMGWGFQKVYLFGGKISELKEKADADGNWVVGE